MVVELFEKVSELWQGGGAADVEAAAADVDTWLALTLVGSKSLFRAKHDCVTFLIGLQVLLDEFYPVP